MGTLRDEVYENLDYLSQLTEVVVGPQNEVLASLPDRFELSLADILHMKSRFYGGTYLYTIDVRSALYNQLNQKSWDVIGDIYPNFEFEVSPDFELDLANNKMTGTIAVVKKQAQIEERRLLEIGLNKALNQISWYDWPVKNLKTRAVTILNLLEPNKGDEWAASISGKKIGMLAKSAIVTLLKQVILENKWRVRDASVITKIGTWINSYMLDVDNGVGLVNLMKLKLMLDKDVPVYSIDEVKSVDPV